MLIPVDHAPDASEAVEFARRAAEIVGDGNVTITLLYVGAEADMPRVHAEDGAGWTFTQMRREGDPVKEILAGHGIGLGRAHHDADPARCAGVFEALRGSTTERVLRHARCPILAVPAAREGVT